MSCCFIKTVIGYFNERQFMIILLAVHNNKKKLNVKNRFSFVMGIKLYGDLFYSPK